MEDRNGEGAEASKKAVAEEPFCKKSWKEDLTLSVQGNKLYVSKIILALESPVFSAMFESDFEERNKDEIELKEKKYEDIVEFLQCLYPGCKKAITLQNVFTVLPLADEYQVDTLKNECKKFLLQEVNQVHKSVHFHLQAQSISFLYNVPEVEEICIKYLSSKSQEEIERAEKIHPLPMETKNRLLTRINKNLQERIKEIEKKFKSENSAKDRELNANISQVLDLQEKEKTLKKFEAFFNKERDYRVQGVVKLDIDDINELSVNGQKVEKMFRGYNWGLEVKKKVVDEKDYFSVWVSFNPGRKHVECNALVTFTIKNKEFGEQHDRIAKLEERIFTSARGSWGFPSLIPWNEFISDGFVENDKASVEMFVMVHHPIES